MQSLTGLDFAQASFFYYYLRGQCFVVSDIANGIVPHATFALCDAEPDCPLIRASISCLYFSLFLYLCVRHLLHWVFLNRPNLQMRSDRGASPSAAK